jgi:hypothetical protein
MLKIANRILAFLLPVVLVVLAGCSGDKATSPEMNHTPVLATIGAQTVPMKDTLELILSATDPDGTTPAISAFNLPANAYYADRLNGTALFTFMPDLTQLGTYAVTFVASDGKAADSEEVIIEVTYPINHPPEFDSIPPYSVRVGENLNFLVTASDVDGDSLELTASQMPLNATFVDHGDGTATFDFTPDSTQVAVFQVWFTVSDGSYTDFQIGYIFVLPASD